MRRGSGRQDAALYGSQDGCRYEFCAAGDGLDRYVRIENLRYGVVACLWSASIASRTRC